MGLEHYERNDFKYLLDGYLQCTDSSNGNEEKSWSFEIFHCTLLVQRGFQIVELKGDPPINAKESDRFFICQQSIIVQ